MENDFLNDDKQIKTVQEEIHREKWIKILVWLTIILLVIPVCYMGYFIFLIFIK